jgi:methylmalonyl-CoA decarboxylase
MVGLWLSEVTARERRWHFVETSAALASITERVVGEAVTALERRDQSRGHAPNPEERRRNVRHLLKLVLRCAQEGCTEPMTKPCQQMAAGSFAAGADFAEAQEIFNVLGEVLWRHVIGIFGDEQRVEALGLVNAIVGAGKDAFAQTYVAVASGRGDRPGQELTAARRGGEADAGDLPFAADDFAGAPVRTEVLGHVGVIVLDDQRKRNAISARLAHGVVAALGSLRAQGMRAVVIRAAAGTDVWSSGHDIDELPRGRRDPLGYNDHIEGLLRAVRTFPAPVIAMVHGTVWGGALDLVLSCDLVTADETASFAITAANLGLPYNTTGLLHFIGRLPINLVKEMFFTAAPLDAQQAREWMVVNHLVRSADLEAFTFELAATMATKSPMAMAVIKEQLRVLTDYQPIAAQVYERIQGLRREAYDSRDYLEGLNAFVEKRPPVFRGD